MLWAALPLGAQTSTGQDFILIKSLRPVPTADFPNPLPQWVHQGLYQKGSLEIPFWFSPSATFFLQGAAPDPNNGQPVRTRPGPRGLYVYFDLPNSSAFVFLFPSSAFPWRSFLGAFRQGYQDLQSLLKGQNPLAVPAFINPDKKK